MGRTEREKNNLGMWLENQRAKDGETLEVQAEKIGVHKSAICHYSTGTRKATRKFLQRVENAYSLTGEERKQFYIATLTNEEIKRAEQVDGFTPEEIAIYIKYGIK
jgi:hypothetical protein